ncbi:unnamed protein product [Arctogadus glacialis]
MTFQTRVTGLAPVCAVVGHSTSLWLCSILFDVTTKGRGVVSVDLGSSAWPLVDFDCNV